MFKMFFFCQKSLVPKYEAEGIPEGSALYTEFAVKHEQPTFIKLSEGSCSIPVSVSNRQIKPTDNIAIWQTTEHIPPIQLNHDIKSIKDLTMPTNLNGQMDAISYLVKENKQELDRISAKLHEHVSEDDKRHTDIEGRLTRLETKVDGLEKGQQVIHDRIEKLQKTVFATNDIVQKIKGAAAITQWATILGATLAGGVLLKLFEVI